MLSRGALSLSAGAWAVAGVGALFGSAPATAGGCLVAFGVLAVQPGVRSAPLPVRVLLWGGLALFGAAVVVHVGAWTDPLAGGMGYAQFVERIGDQGWRRDQFHRDVLVAACVALGFAAFLGIGLTLSRGRLRAVPVAAGLTVVVLVAMLVLPLFGSVTNRVVAVVVLVGGYLWLMAGQVRRYGAVPVAAAGLTLLGVLAWQAADSAARSRPEPRQADPFLSMGMVAVDIGPAVDRGPDLDTALTVTVVLAAVAGTVLACARLAERRR